MSWVGKTNGREKHQKEKGRNYPYRRASSIHTHTLKGNIGNRISRLFRRKLYLFERPCQIESKFLDRYFSFECVLMMGLPKGYLFYFDDRVESAEGIRLRCFVVGVLLPLSVHDQAVAIFSGR